jgi:hypothetical protein
MLDMVGAIACTAIYAAQIGVLAGFAAVGWVAKRTAIAAALAWGGVVVVIGALDGFRQGTTGPVPAPVLAFGASMLLLFGSWYGSRRFRDALLSLPFPALIGLNIARIGGVFFLLLGASGRLSAPFAPAAGVGDMLVGALAIPLAVITARGAGTHHGLVTAWNALGILDLVAAIVIGTLSSPGVPFRVFTEGQGTLAMTGLPWVMVPALLVPFYFLIHFVIAAKLKALQPATGAMAMARAH